MKIPNLHGVFVTTLAILSFPLGGAATARAAGTPTVSEFLNAINCVYLINTVPAGMTYFTNNGEPVTLVDEANGAVSYVYVTAEHQVVIAFQGTTGGLNFLWDPIGGAMQLFTDVKIVLNDDDNGTQPSVFGTSLNFAWQVIALARAKGYGVSDIFVTGHSLGGAEAEYVASQTGLSGIAFEPPGIVFQPAPGVTGANFVCTVTDGDPVPNFASDIHAEQPCAPPYVAGGGRAPHFGSMAFLGSTSDQTALQNYALGLTWWGLELDPWPFVEMVAEFHLPGVQAHDLNVRLNPSNPIVDGIGNMSGEVFDVGDLQIPAFKNEMQAVGRLIKG